MTNTTMMPWPSLEPFARDIHLKENSIDLFYYDTDKDSHKPVCVLLHGMADEADTWRHVLISLSEKYRIIAPDLPGFGRSGKPKINYSIIYYSAVIIELLNRLEVIKAVFMGSSLGGMVSQSLALSHPSMVDQLVLIDGVLLNPQQKMTFAEALFLTPGIGEYFYSSLKKNPDKAYDSLKGYYANLDSMPIEDSSFLYRRVGERLRNPGQRFAFFSLYRGLRRWLHKNQARFRDALRECSIPTLVIWGERDQMIPVKNAESLIKEQKSARLVIIPGAGHLPQQEKPEAFLEALGSILKSGK